jgi:2-hydroxychromene-2-carboxylate isomerase
LRLITADEGRREVEAICRAAEEKGVFGVPSFVIDGELFWGREHLAEVLIRRKRRTDGGRTPDRDAEPRSP